VPGTISQATSHPVVRWLMTDARGLTDSNEFLDAFAHELRTAGVDVARITTGVPILHPQISSFSGLWELDSAGSGNSAKARPNGSTAGVQDSRR
jgi:adenylate cyclase